MKARVAGFAYNDQVTRETIRRIKEETGYTLEPHGAVGWLAAEAWRESHPEAHTVVLETAHPAKFLDVMEEELGAGSVEIPELLGCLADLEKVAISMAPEEEGFSEWLRSLDS
jgi:threonine synthase